MKMNGFVHGDLTHKRASRKVRFQKRLLCGDLICEHGANPAQTGARNKYLTEGHFKFLDGAF